MRTFNRLSDGNELLGLRQTIICREDGGIGVQRRRPLAHLAADLSRRVGRIPSVRHRD